MEGDLFGEILGDHDGAVLGQASSSINTEARQLPSYAISPLPFLLLVLRCVLKTFYSYSSSSSSSSYSSSHLLCSFFLLLFHKIHTGADIFIFILQ